MGQPYPEITIARGLTAALKKVHAKRPKKKGRRREDPMTVAVRDMEMGSVAAGRFYVRSSNVPGVPALAKGWSGGARERLEPRRRNGGEEKGRILYGILETATGTMTVAALAYHLERAGEVEIMVLEATGDLNDYRAMMFQSLTIVAERIALKTTGFKRGKVTYELPRDRARWFRDNLGFREAGRPQKSRVLLCRDAGTPTKATKTAR